MGNVPVQQYTYLANYCKYQLFSCQQCWYFLSIVLKHALKQFAEWDGCVEYCGNHWRPQNSIYDNLSQLHIGIHWSLNAAIFWSRGKVFIEVSLNCSFLWIFHQVLFYTCLKDNDKTCQDESLNSHQKSLVGLFFIYLAALVYFLPEMTCVHRPIFFSMNAYFYKQPLLQGSSVEVQR